MKKATFIIFVLFTSCDPSSFYKKTIQNKSSHNINIIRYNNTVDISRKYIVQDSFLINADMEAILNKGSILGQAPPCVSIVDSFAIKILDDQGLKVTTDLNKETTWKRNSSGNSAKGYIVECKATITNADIVPK